MAQQHEQRDWLAEAADAYDEGDYDRARAAAQIEIAATALSVGRRNGDNIDGIGEVLGAINTTLGRLAR